MVQNCTFPGCKEKYEKGNNITFHRYPWTNAAMFEKWQKVLGNPNPKKSQRICSVHFFPSEIIHGNVVKLHFSAVPKPANVVAPLIRDEAHERVPSTGDLTKEEDLDSTEQKCEGIRAEREALVNLISSIEEEWSSDACDTPSLPKECSQSTDLPSVENNIQVPESESVATFSKVPDSESVAHQSRKILKSRTRKRLSAASCKPSEQDTPRKAFRKSNVVWCAFRSTLKKVHALRYANLRLLRRNLALETALKTPRQSDSLWPINTNCRISCATEGWIWGVLRLRCPPPREGCGDSDFPKGAPEDGVFRER